MTTTATRPFPSARNDVPGLTAYTLSEPTLPAWTELEETFTRQWANSLLAPAIALGPEAYDRALKYVDDKMAERPCAYGTKGFDARVLLPANAPLLLRMTLLRAHPGTTLADAEKLITEEHARDIREAVLGFFGFTFKPRGGDQAKNDGSPRATAGIPTTGQTSGQTSDSSASPPAK